MRLWLWRSWFALAFCFVVFPLWCFNWREWGSVLGMGAWAALVMCWSRYMELADARAKRMIPLEDLKSGKRR